MKTPLYFLGAGALRLMCRTCYQHFGRVREQGSNLLYRQPCGDSTQSLHLLPRANALRFGSAYQSQGCSQFRRNRISAHPGFRVGTGARQKNSPNGFGQEPATYSETKRPTVRFCEGTKSASVVLGSLCSLTHSGQINKGIR